MDRQKSKAVTEWDRDKLAAEVTEIIRVAGDFEAAHSREDDLMKEFIETHATEAELAEFRRLWFAGFPRHSA